MKKHIVIAAALLFSVALFCVANVVQPSTGDIKATKILVEKHRHRMTLYANESVLRVYRVALGKGGEEPKQREGDNRTPEGQYIIDAKNSSSQFYKSLHISYPSSMDIAKAKARGVPPGGAVMIHGLRNDLKWIGALHRLKDWTRGCIAVTDSEMDEIWTAVPIGTLIEIQP